MHIIVLAVALAIGFATTSRNEIVAEQTVEQMEFVPGMVIVQFENPGLAQQTVDALNANPDIQFDKMLFDDDTLRIALFRVPDGREAEFVARIGGHENVAVAELNGMGSFN